MYTLSLLLVCVGVFAADVRALTDEDRNSLRSAAFPILLECAKEHNIKEEDLKNAKEALSAAGLDPCFLDCFLRKLEITDSNGLINVDSAKAKIHSLLKNHEDANKHENIVKTCSAVNDKAVDGNCVRAKLMFECFIQNKADFTAFTF